MHTLSMFVLGNKFKFFFSTVLILFSVSFATRASADSSSLTTTGGVSLGAYEAGYLYYILKFGQVTPDSHRKILTGASAGAINSFLASLEECSESPDIKDSLFWKTWIPLGIDKLMLDNEKKASSLLKRQGLVKLFETIEHSWRRGLRKGCKVYFGVSLTRKERLKLDLDSLDDYSRFSENAVLTITGRGNGLEPSVMNYIYDKSATQMTLPFDNEMPGKNFQIIKNILMASSSFPVAFQSTKLEHCISVPPHNGKCAQQNLRVDEFVDGGVFNNGPLDLSYKIAKSLGKAEETNYYYFDPDEKNFPLQSLNNEEERKEGLIKEALGFSRNFISFSRSSKVSEFLGQHSNILKKVNIIKGNLPLASSPMEGFFGFFEKDIRVFDFYVGMLDAVLFLETMMNQKSPVLNKEFNRINTEWKLLACLRGVFKGEEKVLSQCQKSKDIEYNQKVLFGYSLSRLYLSCSDSRSKNVSTENKFCIHAQNGGNPKDFFPNWVDYSRSKSSSEFNYIISYLSNAKFYFRDLGLSPTESNLGVYAIKKKIKDALNRSIAKQPAQDRLVLNQASSALLNFIIYTPRDWGRAIYIGSNSFEAGYKVGLLQTPFLKSYYKINLGVNINDIDNIFYENRKGIGITPFVGGIIEPSFWTYKAFQIGIIYRLGFQFSSEQGFKTGSCKRDASLESTFSQCSSAVHQFGLDFSILDSIGLKMIYQKAFKKYFSSQRDGLFSLLVGIQF